MIHASRELRRSAVTVISFCVSGRGGVHRMWSAIRSPQRTTTNLSGRHFLQLARSILLDIRD